MTATQTANASTFENLSLHVERNKKTYENVLVTAYKNSTDEEAHVVTLGDLPVNTRYPGLVNIGNNKKKNDIKTHKPAKETQKSATNPMKSYEIL